MTTTAPMDQLIALNAETYTLLTSRLGVQVGGSIPVANPQRAKETYDRMAAAGQVDQGAVFKHGALDAVAYFGRA